MRSKTSKLGFLAWWAQALVAASITLKATLTATTLVALNDHKNSFKTEGNVTLSDIQNSASYEAQSVSVSVGSSSSAGKGQDSGSTSSVTTAGISGIAGDTAKRTGDAAQGIGKIFDAERVSKEIQAQTQITAEFGKNASQAVASYTATQRQALREQMKTASKDDKAALQQQLDQINAEEKVLNLLVGAVTGFGGTMAVKESLKVAAEKMREVMIEDSKKFKGVVDSTGYVLSNDKEGLSEGINGDGKKVGGTRIDLDQLCGSSNERCTFPKKADGSIDTDKPIKFKGRLKADGSEETLKDFLNSTEGIKMRGLAGGVQGAKGTLFGIAYEAGSWQDKLVESFAGTHDVIGGKGSGLYDGQGNAERGRSQSVRDDQDAWSVVALFPSAPFAAAQGMSPEVWKAIGILLGGS